MNTLDDNFAESTETFEAELSNPSGTVVLGDQSQATVEILDNEGKFGIMLLASLLAVFFLSLHVYCFCVFFSNHAVVIMVPDVIANEDDPDRMYCLERTSSLDEDILILVEFVGASGRWFFSNESIMKHIHPPIHS